MNALGLRHSDLSTTVMLPCYQNKITSSSSNDIMASQYLCAARAKLDTLTVTMVPTSTSPGTTNTKATTANSKPEKGGVVRNGTHKHLVKSISELSHSDITFLPNAPQFPNLRLYVVSDDFLWRIDAINTHLSVEPEKLRSNLQREFTKVSHVFRDATESSFVTNENRFFFSFVS